MNSPTYRIKPLVWVKRLGFIEANGCGRLYSIHLKSFCWFCDGYGMRKAASLDAAKAACEQHYRERMMEGLEGVK